MKVVITQKHTEGSSYIANTDCALFRAIKEQHPEFPLSSVGGTFICNLEGERFRFNTNIWNYAIYDTLKAGEIPSVELEIEDTPRVVKILFSES